jgi:hypothetical protein
VEAEAEEAVETEWVEGDAMGEARPAAEECSPKPNADGVPA